jgi:hypothetical protein
VLDLEHAAVGRDLDLDPLVAHVTLQAVHELPVFVLELRRS